MFLAKEQGTYQNLLRPFQKHKKNMLKNGKPRTEIWVFSQPGGAKDKIPPHKVEMTEGKREIIKDLLSEYDIQSAEDIEEDLKDLLGGTIKEMMEAEMNHHLGYEKSELCCYINSFTDCW